MVFVGAASAGLGLLIWLAPASGLASSWYSDLQGESFGQFGNRNHFALLMEMSMGPALGLAISAGNRLAFWSYAATVVLISVALVLANSRGGIISMLVQFAFFSWVWFGLFKRSSLKWTPYGHNRFWRMSEELARRFVLTVLFWVSRVRLCSGSVANRYAAALSRSRVNSSGATRTQVRVAWKYGPQRGPDSRPSGARLRFGSLQDSDP